MRDYSCGEFIFEHLKAEGIGTIVGLPGHGILAFLDAYLGQDEIKVLTVRHEQSAVHFADGCFRATGKPLVVFTSVGPGAMNLLVGLGTAYADSIPVIAFTATCPTYMFGKGALQTIVRHEGADVPTMMGPVVKKTWQVTDASQLPQVLKEAFRIATSGRPGPVHIELPMDVQAASLTAEPPTAAAPEAAVSTPVDETAIDLALDLLMAAETPALLVGGGVINGEASAELLDLVELLGTPVITTLMGKGAIPEDHPLAVFYGGSKGSTCGNAVARQADVVMAVGCRFAEWTTSSYKPGESYSIPPTKLIQIDIDPAEMGRNYPVDVPLLGDARSVLAAMAERAATRAERGAYTSTPYFAHIQQLKSQWEDAKAALINDRLPMTTSRALVALREYLDRDAVVVGAAGHAQAQLFQEFPVYEPRTHISTGAFSTMGFCLPAAMGVKSALPRRQVVGVMGDGDFLMTCQELATAVQHGIPVVCFLLNNLGWLSIRDLQIHHYGEDRTIGTEFSTAAGEPYSPDFVSLAQSFGAHGERVDQPGDIADALDRAFAAARPAVIEVMTATSFPASEGALAGWSDFPTPSYVR